MIDKVWPSAIEAVACVEDGQTVLVGGFGESGVPNRLIDALVERRVRDITVVSNNAGHSTAGLGALLASGAVRRMICSYPRSKGSTIFEALYRKGKIELELMPQGTLAERLRASGAGIGAFFTPTAAGTRLAEGKETREIDGRSYVLEYALKGDVALIRADKADRWGNLTYRRGMRNFGPAMAAAGAVTVAEVNDIVPLGAIDPDHVVTAGVFVDRIVRCGP